MGGEEGEVLDVDLAGDLDEVFEATDDGGLDGEGLAGGGAAGDFGGADGGEFEVGEGGVGGVGLGDDAAELGEGFDEEDARHEGFFGEVPGEEGFVATEEVGGSAGQAGDEVGEGIEEAEGGAVGEGGKVLV